MDGGLHDGRKDRAQNSRVAAAQRAEIFLSLNTPLSGME